MSRLRGNPKGHTCQAWMGLGDKVEGGVLPGVKAPVKTLTNQVGTFIDRGVCGAPAVIRCNACKEYFCEEDWLDHLEMTVVVAVTH